MSRKNKKINFQIYKKIEEETKKEPNREDKIIELFEEFIKKTQKIYSLLNMIGTIMDEKFESNKEIKQQIQSKNKISEDDKVINLSLSKEELDNYKNAYRENNILSLHVEIIPSTFLIYLESSFESFISDVLTLTFNLYPGKLDDSIVKFTFSDLKNLNSIDDAKDYLLKKLFQIFSGRTGRIRW